PQHRIESRVAPRKFAENDGAITQAQVLHRTRQRRPPESLVPMDLIEIQIERRDEIEPPGAGGPDRDRLPGGPPRGLYGLTKKLLQGFERDASAREATLLEAPFGFVHDVPGHHGIFCPVTFDDRTQDAI